MVVRHLDQEKLSTQLVVASLREGRREMRGEGEGRGDEGGWGWGSWGRKGWSRST